MKKERTKKNNKDKRSKQSAANKHNKGYVISIIIVAVIIILVIAGLAITDNLKPLLNEIYKYFQDAEELENNNGGTQTSNIAEGDLIIHFVDVGQGDCIILQLPDNKTMIIDGGDRGQNISQKVKDYIETLKIDTLNYVLLTHTDSDHCGSLDDAIRTVENVEKVFLPKIKTKDSDQNAQMGLTMNVAAIATQVYSDFVGEVLASGYSDAGERKSTEFQFLIDVITIDGGSYRLSLYCVADSYYKNLNASNSKAINDVSPICVLEYANRKVIFTGDANNSTTNTSAEKRFLDAMIAKGIASYNSDVLKVAHHGGKESSGADFLEFISAEYAVICAGEKNGQNSTGNYEGFISKEYYQAGYAFTTKGNGAYDHPHRDIAGIPINGEGRLAQSGISELYRTDTHGDIVLIITDKGDISFKTQKAVSVVEDVIVFVNIKIEILDKEAYLDIYYEERLRMF